MPKSNRVKQRRGQERTRNRTTTNRNTATGAGLGSAGIPAPQAPMPNPGLISGMLSGTGAAPSIAPMPSPPQMPSSPQMPQRTGGHRPVFIPQMPMPMGSVGANALGNMQSPMREEMLPSPMGEAPQGARPSPLGGMFKGLGRFGMY